MDTELTHAPCYPAGNETETDQPHHQRSERDELRAALEYRLGLKPDVYAVADVIEITAEALRSRGPPLEAAAGMHKNRILAKLPATDGASIPGHGRRRLDDALLLLALVVSEHRASDTGADC